MLTQTRTCTLYSTEHRDCFVPTKYTVVYAKIACAPHFRFSSHAKFIYQMPGTLVTMRARGDGLLPASPRKRQPLQHFPRSLPLRLCLAPRPALPHSCRIRTTALRASSAATRASSAARRARLDGGPGRKSGHRPRSGLSPASSSMSASIRSSRAALSEAVARSWRSC